MQIYLVGGAVRDQLLGVEVTDRDWVVVGATPEQMLAQGFVPVGKDFPVFLHPKTKEEYALARTERKTARGYHGFSTDYSPKVSLEDDLSRRDLRINAMAQDESGRIIDPFDGQGDLAHKRLRHVSNAFAEDPVRILRLARFAARLAAQQFVVDTQTEQLCRQMVRDGEVDALVPERVWQEMFRALAGKQPQVFFEVLRRCGALAILLPEIDRLYGVPNHRHWHPEIDSGVHTMMVLQQAARIDDDPLVRFAALTHDLGKAEVPKAQWPSQKGHEDLGLKPLQALCTRYRVPTRYQQIARMVCQYHILCHRCQEIDADSLLNLFEAVDIFRRPERLQQLLLVCMADIRGRTGYEDHDYPQADFLWQLAERLRAVDVKSIAEQADHPAHIADAIRAARLQVINREVL